ncbi:pre-mRNA-splicing factor syf2 [Tyrophagus putrescentiae]|nr:pre-mRNA-splicing factor syf2 [Tyrophagus putrescentiae]
MSSTAEESQPSLSGDVKPVDKKAERLKKLRQLHLKRNEASMQNHKEVVEENKRQQLPTNFARKQEWAKRKLDQVEERERAQEQNLDYDLEKLRNVQADEAERWERKKSSKKNPDLGFSSFEDSAHRKYDRMVKQIKPDFAEYERMKNETPEEQFYATKNAFINGASKDSKEAIDRLVDDMSNEAKKQAKFSRRRTFDDDADIDYINERNMQFNKKIERFYGQYTTEIKQNLERGTAI